MPGSMIHLLVANKVNPRGSTLFYLGNIAPDAVVGWHDKDITHFRNLDDRQPSLISLANDTISDFDEGILLHLYFDWKWDFIVLQKYINETGDDWLIPYRNELSLSGNYAFHNTGWAKQLWHDMDALDKDSYGTTPGASADDVKNFINRNNKWHNENITEPSTAFPPGMIERFTTRIANEYIVWRAAISKPPGLC